jgi:hypothetical protein
LIVTGFHLVCLKSLNQLQIVIVITQEKVIFFLIELINDKGKKEEYEVYFNVARSDKGMLRLFIESAYIRDDAHGGSQPIKKKINFFVIAHKVQNRQEIKIP